MKTESPQRLYCIKNAPDYFLAGHITGEIQMLMNFDASSSSRLIAVRFDAQGNLLDTLIKDRLRNPVYENMAPLVFWQESWKELDNWAKELGLIEGVIGVKKFCLPEHEVCIQDFPEHLQEILDANNELDEDTKEEVQYWQESGLFVFIWGQISI